GLAAATDEQARGERLRLADETGPLAEALAGRTGVEVVEQVTGRHQLRDATAFRLGQAVLHGLDAGVAPDRTALKLVVRELARLLADRHPGRSVEVRVPPYAAVQCLEGPRHTRGTPPNVVEADPVAWVRLCCGREPWTALVARGEVRASGERSDLSALLPLAT
ncbi:MAG: sterol carrier family protein, partial [Mycobacteriales bacterium]